jgi:hypothetical protein
MTIDSFSRLKKESATPTALPATTDREVCLILVEVPSYHDRAALPLGGYLRSALFDIFKCLPAGRKQTQPLVSNADGPAAADALDYEDHGDRLRDHKRA